MIFGSIFASPFFHRFLMDLGTILEVIWEGFCIRWVFFYTSKIIVIFQLILESPRGVPGSRESTRQMRDGPCRPLKGKFPVT